MARLRRAGEALKPIIRELGLEGLLALERIQGNWASLMGQPLASHTSPATLTKGLLTVRVSSHPWMHQLGYQKNVMLERLRPFGVSDLSFVLGNPIQYKPHSAKATTEPEPPPSRALTQEESTLISELLKPVAEDEELSRLIASAIAKSIRKASRLEKETGGRGKNA